MLTILNICMAVLLVPSVFFGVLSGNGETAEASENQKLSIVTTIFPEYDWVRETMGDEADRAEITMLLDSGVDLHNYQPTVDDIIKISNCDLFIYVGGESDGWVEDALAGAANKNMTVINLLEVLGDAAREEELVEGMEDGHYEDEHGEGDHGEGDAEEKDHEDEEAAEEAEYDEHVWLSLKNASVFCRCIADTLGSLDAERKDSYEANAAAYIEKLDELDQAYQDAADATSVKTLLFGDRFPFRYLVDDYGLDYFAAFTGCSAETEASFETIVFLAGKADELGLSAIMQVEGSDGSIARTVRDNTASKDQAILTLDSMQGTMFEDVEAGATYLSVMESNLDVLRKALE